MLTLILLHLACSGPDPRVAAADPAIGLDEAVAGCLGMELLNERNECAALAVRSRGPLTAEGCARIPAGDPGAACFRDLALSAPADPASYLLCERAGSFRDACVEGLWVADLEASAPLDDPRAMLRGAREVMLRHRDTAGRFDRRFVDHLWIRTWSRWWATQPDTAAGRCDEAFVGGDRQTCLLWRERALAPPALEAVGG